MSHYNKKMRSTHYNFMLLAFCLTGQYLHDCDYLMCVRAKVLHDSLKINTQVISMIKRDCVNFM